MKKQIGFTPPGFDPPYINVREISDSTVRVTVRSPKTSDPNVLVSQPVAYIDMTEQELFQFLIDVQGELER